MNIPAIDEEWRPIPGWPEYEVSSLGRVKLAIPGYRKAAGYVLTPWLNRDRLQVELRAKGRRKKQFVHQLVVLAFIGVQPTPDHEIAHWDGDASNNTPGNLRWATPLENAQDRDRHGHTAKGEKSGVTNLTDEDALAIRAMSNQGHSQRAIAERFTISKHAVWSIVHRRTWKHLGETK